MMRFLNCSFALHITISFQEPSPSRLGLTVMGQITFPAPLRTALGRAAPRASPLASSLGLYQKPHSNRHELRMEPRHSPGHGDESLSACKAKKQPAVACASGPGAGANRDRKGATTQKPPLWEAHASMDALQTAT